ncbi:MAG TPA: septation protein SepH [Pedococcus sp.]|uniref:septation protein SepH n=1 Tax=Pedococcus sp. TaxID=2860345 RepID=UPI002F9330FC
MQDLRLIGVHEDGQHLLLADPEGNRYRVPLDEPLRAAARRDRPRLGQLQIEMDGSMRPREVQSLIRAGASAEEVAERSGWPVEKVRRYEGPVLAEREHVAGLARTVTLRGRGGSQGSAPTLAARVGQRLSGRGVDPAVVEWDSARDDEGAWTVILTFPAGGRQRQARWLFDVPARTVTAIDDEARWLSEDDSSGAQTPIPAPHLVSAPVRATTVYDVEAEGGVSASARRKTSPEAPAGERPAQEPVDLMTAMRERASARGKRGSRRKAPATKTPVDDAPRDDALPLEDIAYDPETMPPPPPARGTHPSDAAPRHEVGDDVGDDVLPAADATTPDVDAATAAVDATGAEETEPDTLPDSQPDTQPDTQPGVDADTEAEAPRRGGSGSGDESEDEVGDSRPREPEATTTAPARPARRSGRPSVPSWDDVMFGAKPRD